MIHGVAQKPPGAKVHGLRGYADPKHGNRLANALLAHRPEL